MNQLKTLLLASFFALILMAPAVTAQIETKPAAPANVSDSIVAPDYFPQPSKGPSIFGQDHHYTVTFRGNGEAVVSLKTIFSNLQEGELKTISYRIPKVDPQDIIVYQVQREPVCIRYKPTPQPLYDPQGAVRMLPEITQPECLEYQDPDYYQYWYGNNSYHRATFTVQTDTLLVELPKAVKENATASLLIYYRAFGYAKKNIFGAYNFTFESLKTEDAIRTLQVGIQTDSDLLLRGAKGQVDYRVSDSAIAMGAPEAAGRGVKNAQLDTYFQQIGQGTITKSASNLQPLDSYTVKGAYAASAARLYGKEIATGILIFIVIIVVLFLLVRRVLRTVLHRAPAPDMKQKPATAWVTPRTILEVAGLSFLSSLFIAGYTLAMFFGVNMLNNYYYYQFNMIIILFVMVISVGAYGLFLFGPALIMGVRRGLWQGIATFALTIGWLVFYLVVLFLIMFMTRFGNDNPRILPYPMGDVMMKGMESSAGQAMPSAR